MARLPVMIGWTSVGPAARCVPPGCVFVGLAWRCVTEPSGARSAHAGDPGLSASRLAGPGAGRGRWSLIIALQRCRAPGSPFAWAGAGPEERLLLRKNLLAEVRALAAGGSESPLAEAEPESGSGSASLKAPSPRAACDAAGDSSRCAGPSPIVALDQSPAQWQPGPARPVA